MSIFDKNKNLSYRFPSFYNSTWHKYSIPSTSWLVTQPVFSIGNIDTSNMVANAQNGVNWNPFGWTAMSMTGYNPNTGLYGDPSIVTSPREILPTNRSYLAPPAPYKPFNPSNYSSSYDYDDIYNNGEPVKSTANKGNINTLKGVFGGLSAAADAIGQGRTTGDNDANHYISMVGKLGSNLPGVWGTLFSGLNLGSSLVNALVGSKLNDQNIKAMDAAILNRARYLFGDNSTTDALIAGSQSNVDLAAPEADFYGKDGLLLDWLGYGVGKAHGKAWSNKRLIGNANTQAHNTELLAYKDFLNKMIRRGLLSEPYALGGAINRFDNGGGINTPRTHGSLFNTGLTEINAGGRHSENLFGGVLFGVDQYGIPNLVEEGETVFNAQSYGGPLDYAFSDEIEFPIKEYGHLFSLGGITKRKKGKYKKYTFADVSKYLAEDIKLNPNSEIVKRTFAENAGKLANIQEEVKAKNMINLMNPMDIMMALQQSPMGEQMVSDTLGSMDLQAMIGQQPMMAACGGKLHACGGNLFAYGGNLFAKGGSAGGNHTFIDGKKINSLPESIILHDDLFSKAISEYIADNKLTYDQAIKDKDFEKAKNIMSSVYSYINTINEYYARTYNTPDGTPDITNLAILLNAFDQAGLNKYVNDFLSSSKRVFRGKSLYSSDNPLDVKNGVITLNRYITLSDKDIETLHLMGLTAGNLWDVYNMEGLTLGDNPYDVVKNLQGVKLRDPITSFLVQNPKYTEGGLEPQYLNPYDVFKDSAPEGTTDLSKWWNDLSLDDKLSIILKGGYKRIGDPTQLSPLDFLYIIGLENGNSGNNGSVTGASVLGTASSSSNNKGLNEYYVPKPRNDWESTAAMLIGLRDDILAQLSNSRDFTPGADAAYSYLSRVGNVPMVRSTPTGTRMTYRPTDLNFGLNNDRSDMFGLIRTAGNLNKGNAVANDIAIMNAGRELMAKTRLQAVEEDLKKLQFVLSNNNQVDQFNAQNSLTAQTTNAQNLARARETQASIASQLASTLGQGYKNWIDYRNAQSSGLAQMLHDQGYNKQILNLRDAAFLLNNQQKDALKTAGIPYEVVQDVLNTYRG